MAAMQLTTTMPRFAAPAAFLGGVFQLLAGLFWRAAGWPRQGIREGKKSVCWNCLRPGG